MPSHWMSVSRTGESDLDRLGPVCRSTRSVARWIAALLFLFAFISNDHSIAAESASSPHDNPSGDVTETLASDRTEHSPHVIAAGVVEHFPDRGEGSCGCNERCCCARGGDIRWTAAAGALFLKRSTPDAIALMEATAAPGRQLNARQFEFDFETGWEASIQAASACGEWGLEGRFMSLDSWTAAATSEVLTDMANPLRINTSPPLFVQDVQTVNAVYASDFLSAEFNLRRELDSGPTFLSGFRYVELDEWLETDLVGSSPRAVYNVNAANRMYGYQLGLDHDFGCFGGVMIDANLKAGIYYNHAQGSSTFDNGAVTLNPVDSNDGVAFLGEIGVNAGYQLTHAIALRAGYNLVWVEGVALASEQTAVTDFFTRQGIDDQGGVFLHGATAGLEIVW